MRATFPAVVCLLLLVHACRPAARVGPRIGVDGAWVRGFADQAAVYMDIQNEGKAGDVLIGARTEAAGQVGLHRSVMAGEVLRMEPVPRLEVPPGARVKLEPGGMHFMVTGLKRRLEPGEKLRLLLQFEKSGEVVVDAQVRGLEGAAPPLLPAATESHSEGHER